MPKTLHGVSGRLIAKPGQGAALLRVLLEAACIMEEVPGNLCYIVSTLPDRPDAVHVYEVWTDAAAHQASLNLPQVQALIGGAMPIIAGMENDPDLVVQGGKTSPLS